MNCLWWFSCCHVRLIFRSCIRCGEEDLQGSRRRVYSHLCSSKSQTDWVSGTYGAGTESPSNRYWVYLLSKFVKEIRNSGQQKKFHVRGLSSNPGYVIVLCSWARRLFLSVPFSKCLFSLHKYSLLSLGRIFMGSQGIVLNSSHFRPG